jgi:hypothetical protein
MRLSGNYPVDSGEVAQEIWGEYLQSSLRESLTDSFEAADEMLGSSIRQIVTGYRGDHDMS